MAALATSPFLRALEGPGLLHRVVEALSGPEDALFFALACRACRDAVWADPRFTLSAAGKRFRTRRTPGWGCRWGGWRGCWRSRSGKGTRTSE
eukprot:SAG22_NODE_8089_length_684_cov_1.263248_1_plen_93_part_00